MQCLTKYGEVFAFGANYNGQLGLGDTDNRAIPFRVEQLRGKRIVQVSAGGGHSLALSVAGEVFGYVLQVA